MYKNKNMNSNWFDKDYYMRGIESGKSNYQNYRWIPELTIPLAMTIIDLLEIKKGEIVLDFGCAFGYLVKAFRLLHRQAYGCDTSKYAMDNIDPSVRDFCDLSSGYDRYDYCIAKDVFEHIPKKQIISTLKKINSDRLFAVIPLGSDGKYYAHANNFDKSHVICEDSNWWAYTIEKAGWGIENYFDSVEGIKDSYKKGTHGFFIATKRS